MKPIGLVLKDEEYNPFTHKTSGEVMLVHYCLSCERISCNRIAGDDDSFSVLALLENPEHEKYASMLTQENREQVRAALFGYDTSGD